MRAAPAGSPRFKSCLLSLGAAIIFLAGPETYFVVTEPTNLNLWLVSLVTVLLALCFVLMFKRACLGVFLAAALTASICGLSTIKKQMMSLSLHAYDFVLYLNLDTLKYVWHDFPVYVLSSIATLCITGLLAIVIWRLDPTRIPRALSALAICVLAVPLILLVREDDGRRPIFNTYPPISFFYLSWNETAKALWAGHILDATFDETLPPLVPMAGCDNPGRAFPNVLLIHEESLFPPSIFPELSYDHALDRFFLSDDHQVHKLKVETWGGGSWMTEFSLLVGLSTRSFGNLRPFLHIFLRGNLKETLPRIFAACGFHTQLFVPADQGFLSMDRFYRANGYEKVFDRRAQGTQEFRERDRFYFTNALNEIERQLRIDDRPSFTFVQTMASHEPYRFVYLPDEKVSGGGPGTPKPMSEFLRRMAIDQIDQEFLLAEINRRFPNRPFLVVRYGDHQPDAAGYLLNARTISQKEITFYAMTGINYVVPPLPSYEALAIPFLGTVMLNAAHIPLPPSYQERERLMKACNGKYYDCRNYADILAFHGRLLRAGLIEAD